MYGETFYGLHTAQHQLQWIQSINTDRRTSNNNEPQQMYRLLDIEVSLFDFTGTLITL